MAGRRRAAPLIAILAALLIVWPAALQAAVRITFYSKELGTSFPHAFVTLDGNLERNNERIAVDYGFTAKTLTPAILFGHVAGEVISDHGASYIRSSDKHFSLVLADEDYDKVMATIARWRGLKQPSYDLDTRNCVHFVADIAASLGMKADTPRKLAKKPRSFLLSLAAANRPWLVAHNATLYRGQ